MKYLVMECHTAYAVVLSDEGQFLKVANLRYQVGQRVSQVVEMSLPQEPVVPRKKKPGWVPVIASLAACLTLVFGGWFVNFMPYASVYVAINPEVRIDVSRTDRVVDVTGVNQDGETLLAGYTLTQRKLDLVMDELVDRAIDMGYLHEGGTVTLTLEADDHWVADHETKLNSHLASHLEKKMAVTIDITAPGKLDTLENVSGGQSVVVPVDPDSHYGDSAYGTSDYHPEESGDGESGYAAQEPDDSGYDAPQQEKQSDYGEPEKDSGYDGHAQEKDSHYGSSSYREHGDSSYEAPEKDSDYDDHSDNGDSGYEEPDEGSDYDDD